MDHCNTELPQKKKINKKCQIITKYNFLELIFNFYYSLMHLFLNK